MVKVILQGETFVVASWKCEPTGTKSNHRIKHSKHLVVCNQGKKALFLSCKMAKSQKTNKPTSPSYFKFNEPSPHVFTPLSNTNRRHLLTAFGGIGLLFVSVNQSGICHRSRKKLACSANLVFVLSFLSPHTHD